MQLTSDEPIIPPPPIARYGQLEVDAFCTGCYYNLHGQPVTIDERLGIPICRCPECGRFHPAGVGVTASSIWVRRWATVLLFVWAWIVIAVTAIILFTMGGMSTASVEMFADGQIITPQGLPVTQNYTNGVMTNTVTGTNTVVSKTVYAEFPRPWYGVTDDNHPGISAMLIVCLVSLLLGLLAGMLCVTLLWHWPRYRYLLFGLLPAIPWTFLTLIYANNDQYRFMRAVALEHIGFQSALQCVGLLIGVKIGRSVSRTIARTIIPPKSRQALAFLWQVDGKQFPADMQHK